MENKKITASGFVNPLLWDQKNKDFSLWLWEAKAWKCNVKGIQCLKGVPGLQLALHLPKGSESRLQIFDTFDSDEMKCENGSNAVIDSLKLHYKKMIAQKLLIYQKKFRTLSHTQG